MPGVGILSRGARLTWLAAALALACVVQWAAAQDQPSRRAVVVSTAAEFSQALRSPDVWDITITADMDMAPELPTWQALPGNLLLEHDLRVHGQPGANPCIDWGRWQMNGTFVNGFVLAPGNNVTFANLTVRNMLNNAPDIIRTATPSATVVMDNVIQYRYAGNAREFSLNVYLNLPDAAWESPDYIQALVLPQGFCRTAPTRQCWNTAFFAIRDKQDCCGQLALNNTARLITINNAFVAEEIISDECRAEFYAGNKTCVEVLIAEVRARTLPGRFWPQPEASQELVNNTMAAFHNEIAAYLANPPPRRARSNPTTNLEANTDDGSKRALTPQGIGAIVGAVGFVVLLVALAALWVHKKKKEQQSDSNVVDGRVVPASKSPDRKEVPGRDSTDSEGSSVPDSVSVMVNDKARSSELAPSSGSPVAQSVDSRSEHTSGSPSCTGVVALMEMVTPASPMKPTIATNLKLGKDVILGPVIGRGAMGTVYRATYQGQPVAVKLFNPGQHANTFHSEMDVLGRIRHPNVVRLLGTASSGDQVALVEELEDGSLDQLLFPSGTPESRLSNSPAMEQALPTESATHESLMPLPLLLHIATEVATSLAYLHPTIIHRDIKPGNVLLRVPPSMLDADGRLPHPSSLSNKAVAVKLSDFGLSRILDSLVFVTGVPDRGTLAYMAPECFTKGNTLTYKADIFSFGILLWEMVHGRRPWCTLTLSGIQNTLSASNKRLDITDDESRCPAALKRLIQACWQGDAELRPAALEIVRQLSVIQQGLAAEATA